LDASLYPALDFETETGASSGIAFAGIFGLRTTAASTGAGTIERIDLANFETYHATPTFEAPLTASTLATPSVGQIGQTILPFTRSLALSPDQSSVLMLGPSGLTVIPLNFDAAVSIPVIAGVANAADGGPAASGGLISIWGSNLAPAPAVAGAPPWPYVLGEVCATVNSEPLPLFRVSPTEIGAQLPTTVSGTVPLVLQTPGGASASFLFNVQGAAPAIFHSGTSGDQTGLATVVRLKNNDLVTFTNPIHPDEMITIYLTGMGQTTPDVRSGDPAPFDPLALVVTPPIVAIGMTQLEVTYAGLTPGEAGVYQINAYVPHGIADAVQTPLTITQGSASTVAYVRVVNP
jgi:uncharacterized protein (TIGR03437 family)